jgi:hypothetical protein
MLSTRTSFELGDPGNLRGGRGGFRRPGCEPGRRGESRGQPIRLRVFGPGQSAGTEEPEPTVRGRLRRVRGLWCVRGLWTLWRVRALWTLRRVRALWPVRRGRHGKRLLHPAHRLQPLCGQDVRALRTLWGVRCLRAMRGVWPVQPLWRLQSVQSLRGSDVRTLWPLRRLQSLRGSDVRTLWTLWRLWPVRALWTLWRGRFARAHAVRGDGRLRLHQGFAQGGV